MNRKRVNSWLLLAIASLPYTGLLAADAMETPSLELLQFLGEWETSDGEWLDPIELLEEIEAEQSTAQTEEQSDG